VSEARPVPRLPRTGENVSDTISISVEEAVAKELRKRDTRIAKLEAELVRLTNENKLWRERFTAIKILRHTIVDAAYAVDDYFGDEGP
jgi:hypothetical protein